ncbi:hypothetical protein [Daejeonella sp.]|uniref:hypothetical protein n=1 Tax=Daejeonella sp. TaxID=2805397 RepID=UPI0030C4C74F
MLDTIKIHISPSYLTPELSQHFRNILENQGYNRGEYGETYSGTLKNIRVKVNDGGITVEGSLPKYINGNNQLTLTKEQAEEGIKKLGEELRLPLMEGKVKRLDTGAPIISDLTAKELYQVCGEAPRFNRLEQNSGLYYAQTKRYMALYDKGNELKKGEQLLDAFKGKHVLRYEYRWLCHQTLAKDLGLTEVLMKDVFANYDILIKKWASAFLMIVKNHDMITFNAEAFKDTASFNNQILIQGVERVGGLQAVLQAINVAKDRGDFGKTNNLSYLKRKYTTLMTHPVLSEKSPVGKEVEDKVKAIAFAMGCPSIESQILNG